MRQIFNKIGWGEQKAEIEKKERKEEVYLSGAPADGAEPAEGAEAAPSRKGWAPENSAIFREK